jgi:3-deoxy-D-manno-octulosonic-acid transferase
MIAVYRILFLPALLLALPYYLWRMWRRGGYRDGFGGRLGNPGNVPAKRAGVKRIWIQAVSVGEILAIEPVIRRLAALPGCELWLTTTTSTGYRLARERYAACCLRVAVFPLDFWPCSAAAWRRVQPDLVVLTESELWPEHLHQARRRGVPALLVNARISDRSFRRYRRWRDRLRPLYRHLAAILAASEQDAARFRELGWIDAVRRAGNLKFDFAPPPLPDASERTAQLAELGFAADPAQPAPLILLGSSTWPGEEAALLDVLQAGRAAGLPLRLLLVPRHAERRAEIERLLRASPWRHHFRSQARAAPAAVDVYVADTTGELRHFTRFADLVFVGKSLPPHHEGQTPIEAAAIGRPVLFGPGMGNFRAIARALVDKGAARVVTDAAALSATARDLLRDPAARARMAAAGHAHWQRQRGATDRIVAAITAAAGMGDGR